MPAMTFHLLPNAHLDPVWLWDWREGLNEGIITTRTVLDLMDEFPDLTFMRGEAALYQHIEEHDPVTFRRVQRMIEAGRWDVVGGTWVQPDTNMPATETFLRHFALGQAYFASRFGFRPRVAWAAVSRCSRARRSSGCARTTARIFGTSDFTGARVCGRSTHSTALPR